MSSLHTAAENRKRFTSLGLLVAVGSGLLFVYFVKRVGVGQIANGIRNLGIGFLLVLAISAVRHVARSIAWIFCVEGSTRLPFWDALRARLMGDAIGNALPFASFIISEPAKPILIRDRVPLPIGFSSIVIENIFYSLSVMLFITAGTLATLLTFQSHVIRIMSLITLGVVFVIGVAGAVCIHREIKFVSGAVHLLNQLMSTQRWLDRAQNIEARVYRFCRYNQSRFLPILVCEASFHCAGVLEVYTTLSFINPSHRPTLFMAFILESVNRLINMIFKFVPLRLGVDEAGTGKVSALLQLTEPARVTLAIIRKARDLFWSFIGVGLLFHRQITLRRESEKFSRESTAHLMPERER